MSINWRTNIVLFKTESTYGVDPTPTGGANAILTTQGRIMPMEGNDVSRDLERPFLGGQPTIAVEVHAKLSFRVELAPSGTAGTAPAWGPLMRACAFAETVVAATSVTYNPVSSGHESGTFYFYNGDTLHKFRGGRGNVTIRVDANAIPYLEFEFTGLFSTPAEGTRPTPDHSTFQGPLAATDTNTPTFTIGGTDHVLRRFMLNAGNQVETRFLVGSESVLITDKLDAVEMTIEAVPLSTLDPYTLALNASNVAVNLVHGTAAGGIATVAIPTMQFQRPTGLENAQNITEWPLKGVPLPASGNDQWTLALT